MYLVLELLLWGFLIQAIVLLVPMILPIRHWLRYYAMYVMFAYTYSFACLLLLPIFAMKPRSKMNIAKAGWMATLGSKISKVKYVVRNPEKIADPIPGVILINHQSIVDSTGIIYTWHLMGECTAVSKKSILWAFPFGQAAWLGGALFIDRSKGSSAYAKLHEVAKRELCKEGSKTRLIMYPEGTRNKNPNALLPFKKGAFRLAIDLQVPLMPIVYSRYYFINSEKKMFESGTIIVSFLDPIPTKGMTADDVDTLTKTAHEIMTAEYQKLNKELEPFVVKEKIN